MTQQIADYFKTQPVLKAWLFGSFARGYFQVRKDMLWNVIQNDLQPLRNQIEEYLTDTNWEQ